MRTCHGGCASSDQGIPALALPAGPGRADLVLPLERDGFLADFRIRRAASPRLTLDDVDSGLAAISDPRDSAGVASSRECREALATLRLRDRCLPVSAPGSPAAGGRVLGHGPGRAACSPTRRSRPRCPIPPIRPRNAAAGLSEDDSLRYAPEYLPEFELRWVAVPRSRLAMAGSHERPPVMMAALPEVGLPESLADTHDLVPVHPVTARHELARALDEAGLTGAGPMARPGRGTGDDRARYLAAGDPYAVRPHGGCRRPAPHPYQAAAPDEHSGPAEPPLHPAGHPGGRRSRAGRPGSRGPR